MATIWGDVANKVKDRLTSSIDYAKITIIGSTSDYINNSVAQTIVNDINILLAPPGGEVYKPSNDPLLSGFFRKKYDIEILVVVKTDPKGINRIINPPSNKKAIDRVLSDIHSALEHNNLGGFVDNKAGSNFEVGWSRHEQEDRATTIFTTIYTVIVTER